MSSTLSRRPKAVLATFGTYGDVHPFIALAIALKQRGVEPTIAAAESYRSKIEAERIAFYPMRPDVDEVATRLDMDQQQIARAIAARPEFILTDVVLPSLRESYEDAMAVMRDADMAITNSVAYGAQLAAEKCRLPHFGVALQPFVFLSVYDPPIVATLPRASAWIFRFAPWCIRAFFGLGKIVARRWARPIDALRREIGLPPATTHPLFEGQFAGNGAIGMFSPLFGAAQPDHPPNTSIVGFAFYDSDAGGPPTLSDELRKFLDAGPPPIVFTQGTSAVHDAHNFVRESMAAVRELDARAVFVLDDEQSQNWALHASDRILLTGYAPYSLLFSRALINVHHGGVGTTAQALRSGRPQLIAPYLVDQPDNAARVVRMGAGRSLALKRYRTALIVEELRHLMNDAQYTQRAQAIGAQVANEDGAAAAADIIVAAIPKPTIP
ncbi:MAG: glycosyltransferase [Rudaea sp.]